MRGCTTIHYRYATATLISTGCTPTRQAVVGPVRLVPAGPCCRITDMLHTLVSTHIHIHSYPSVHLPGRQWWVQYGLFPSGTVPQETGVQPGHFLASVEVGLCGSVWVCVGLVLGICEWKRGPAGALAGICAARYVCNCACKAQSAALRTMCPLPLPRGPKKHSPALPPPPLAIEKMQAQIEAVI